MYKFSIKNQVKRLRREGDSLNEIALKIHLPKSTISRWCKNVVLSKSQLNKLFIKKIRGLKQGRIKGILSQRLKRLEKLKNYKVEGDKRFSRLSSNDVFIAGLFVYLAKGSKRNISFSDDDTVMIKFIVKWFETYFKITSERFIFTIFTPKKKAVAAKRLWIKHLGFPKKQFKIMKSDQERLNFRILKSTDLFYRILGLAYGFFKNHRASRG